jgi:hypothetical protein
MSGMLKQLSRTTVSAKMISSLDYSRWQGRTHAPALLVSAADSMIRYMAFVPLSLSVFSLSVCLTEACVQDP